MSVIHFEWSRGGEVLSLIDADFNSHKIRVQNFTKYPMDNFFGSVDPTWEKFEVLLEQRVVPKNRDYGGLKRYLKSIDVDFWDPIRIIRKTDGEMAEDNFRLKIVKEDINEWII